jgi:cephalosporin-C deacetylase-like acetyl esterase
MCTQEIKSYLDYYHNECSFEDAPSSRFNRYKRVCRLDNLSRFFTTALFDDDCPPHMGFAAYNRIKSPKRFKIYPDDSHLGESDNYTEMKNFLLSQ